MIPPLLCTMAMGSGPRGRFSLWLPLFLLWPFVFLLLLPILVLVLLVLPWSRQGRVWLKAGGYLYQIVCSCRGLIVNVRNRRELVSITLH